MRENQIICIGDHRCGDVEFGLVVAQVGGRVVYIVPDDEIRVREFDEISGQTLLEGYISPELCKMDGYKAVKARQGVQEPIVPGHSIVESTYGFYLFGKYKCRERGQWIPCQVSYNEQMRRWSVDVHEGLCDG